MSNRDLRLKTLCALDAGGLSTRQTLKQKEEMILRAKDFQAQKAAGLKANLLLQKNIDGFGSRLPINPPSPSRMPSALPQQMPTFSTISPSHRQLGHTPNRLNSSTLSHHSTSSTPSLQTPVHPSTTNRSTEQQEHPRSSSRPSILSPPRRLSDQLPPPFGTAGVGDSPLVTAGIESQIYDSGSSIPVIGRDGGKEIEESKEVKVVREVREVKEIKEVKEPKRPSPPVEQMVEGQTGQSTSAATPSVQHVVSAVKPEKTESPTRPTPSSATTQPSIQQPPPVVFNSFPSYLSEQRRELMARRYVLAQIQAETAQLEQSNKLESLDYLQKYRDLLDRAASVERTEREEIERMQNEIKDMRRMWIKKIEDIAKEPIVEGNNEQ